MPGGGRVRMVPSGLMAVHGLVSVAAPPIGNPLYVNATTGDDSRTLSQARSSATPWASLHRAMKGAAPGAGTNSAQAAAAGDTVIVTDLDSIYNVYGTNSNGFGGTALEPVNSGSSGAPIRIQAGVQNYARAIRLQWGDSNRGAILGGNAKSYLEFAGFDLDETVIPSGLYDTGPSWSQTAMMWLSGCQHVKVQRSKFKGIQHTDRGGDNYAAVRLHGTGVGNIEFADCHFTDWGVVSGGSANNSPVIWYFVDGPVLFEYCLFERSGAGMYWKADGGENTFQCIVRYSIIRDCKEGIAFFVGANGIAATPHLVYQNLIYGHLEKAVRFGHLGDPDPPYNYPNDIKLLNNVLRAPTPIEYRGSFANEIAVANLGNLVQNNIVLGSGSSRAYYDDSGAFRAADLLTQHFNHQRNLYKGVSSANFSNLGGGTNESFAQWQARGYDTDSSITSATIFVDEANHDYHLAGGSPALNLGRALWGVGGVDGTTIHAGPYLTGSETIGLRL